MTSTEEQIKKMYQSQIDAQKEQLKQDYLKADADYQAQKDTAQKITEANLNRTAVEAQKAAVSQEELNNAYGLSSGARAQSRLVRDMQTQSDIASLRAQQQEVDAEAERQRSLLAQEYSSAIRQAQAENDLAKAQALYAEAQRQNDELLSTKKEAANLMAGVGNYDRLAEIYGLTPDELAELIGGKGYKQPAADVPVSDEKNDDGDKPSANAQKFVNRMTDADTFAKYGYVEVDGKGYTDYKAYVMAVLNRWIENGIPEKALDTGGDKKLTNAEIAYLVQYYGLG